MALLARHLGYIGYEVYSAVTISVRKSNFIRSYL